METCKQCKKEGVTRHSLGYKGRRIATLQDGSFLCLDCFRENGYKGEKNLI